MSKSVSRTNPPTLPDSTQIGYSQISIAESGRTAYVSGQVASLGDGSLIPDDIAEQTKRVVLNLQAALDALGADTEQIILLRIYVVDLNDEKLNSSFPILLDWLEGAQPSVTGIGVSALASPDYMLEIEMAVKLPD